MRNVETDEEAGKKLELSEDAKKINFPTKNKMMRKRKRKKYEFSTFAKKEEGCERTRRDPREHGRKGDGKKICKSQSSARQRKFNLLNQFSPSFLVLPQNDVLCWLKHLSTIEKETGALGGGGSLLHMMTKIRWKFSHWKCIHIAATYNTHEREVKYVSRKMSECIKFFGCNVLGLSRSISISLLSCRRRVSFASCGKSENDELDNLLMADNCSNGEFWGIFSAFQLLNFVFRLSSVVRFMEKTKRWEKLIDCQSRKWPMIYLTMAMRNDDYISVPHKQFISVS